MKVFSKNLTSLFQVFAMSLVDCVHLNESGSKKAMENQEWMNDCGWRIDVMSIIHQSSNTKPSLPCTIFSKPPLQNAFSGLSVCALHCKQRVSELFVCPVIQKAKDKLWRPSLMSVLFFWSISPSSSHPAFWMFPAVFTSQKKYECVGCFKMSIHERALTCNIECCECCVCFWTNKSLAQCNCSSISYLAFCEPDVKQEHMKQESVEQWSNQNDTCNAKGLQCGVHLQHLTQCLHTFQFHSVVCDMTSSCENHFCHCVWWWCFINTLPSPRDVNVVLTFNDSLNAFAPSFPMLFPVVCVHWNPCQRVSSKNTLKMNAHSRCKTLWLCGSSEGPCSMPSHHHHQCCCLLNGVWNVCWNEHNWWCHMESNPQDEESSNWCLSQVLVQDIWHLLHWCCWLLWTDFQSHQAHNLWWFLMESGRKNKHWRIRDSAGMRLCWRR